MGVVIPRRRYRLSCSTASHHVVRQIRQADLSCCPCIADSSDVHGFHRIGQVAKDVFDSGTVTGLLTVRGL